MKSRNIVWTVVFLLALAALRLVRAGIADSMDFNVYWKAAQQWAGHGVSPYLYGAADRGFVFKYPPWILPLFFPFGWMSETASRAAWAGVELLCLGYSVWKLIRFGVDRRVAAGVAFAFWWIWLAHFYAGQFTIVLLAVALWAIPVGRPASAFNLSALGVIFTTKVFSLISMIGLLPKLLRPKTIATGVLLVAALNFWVMAWFRLHGNDIGIVELYRQWMQAAGSGGQELGDIVVRGQMNHGFTAGILRALGISAKDTRFDPWIALGLGAIFSVIWWRVCQVRRLSLIESWVGWLGIGLIVHPLAWHHSFVLAYPVCVVALDRAIVSKNGKIIALAALGICCIGIFIPNVIGPDLVKPLELVSVKSWGVCFSAAALAWTKKTPAAG
ncbi:MAG: glycosyltransferase family 87 protein [Oligoflexia bacterium]|nr:glycosyltransferase family 87 protein [Oligoflexia bacterium]